MFVPLGDDVDTRTLPMVGLVLIGINLLVFVLMIRALVDEMAPSTVVPASYSAIESFRRAFHPRDVVLNYGLTAKDLQNKRFVGAVTYMFIHGGLMHLLGNMIVLWAFVGTLEHAMGAWKFLGFYLLWGILAGLAEAAMHWGSNIPLVGASGAIAGMIGAYWVAFGASTRIRTLVWIIRPRVYMIPAGVFVAIWIGFQLKGILESSPEGGGVAWFCHLGGFLAGAGTMLILRHRNAREMVQNRQGDVVFLDRPGKADQHDADDYIMLATCPYSHTEVTDETSIAPNLARCPNTACGRMVLLERHVLVESR